MPDLNDANADELDSTRAPSDRSSYLQQQQEAQANVNPKEVPERLTIKMEKPKEKTVDVTLPDEDISFSSSDEKDSSTTQLVVRKDSRRRFAIGLGVLSILLLVTILSVVLTSSSKVSDRRMLSFGWLIRRHGTSRFIMFRSRHWKTLSSFATLQNDGSSNMSDSAQNVVPSPSPQTNPPGSHPQVPESAPTNKPSEIDRPSFPIYVNCGATKTHKDSSGPNITWIPDDAFLDGDSHGSSSVASCQKLRVDATIDNEILCTGRTFTDKDSPALYEIPALKSSAVYLIILYFIDWEDNWSRTFDVVIEGYTIFSNLNVLLEAGGPNSMYKIESAVQVVDGSISIELARVSGDPIIAGIEIHKTDLPDIPEPITQESKRDVTYIPGNLTVYENGLILSEGLTAKIIGNSSQPLTYVDGRKSDIPFHILPDAGACFVDPRPWNVGGWIYASNSEAPKVKDGDAFPGGVGALTFDKDGELIDYRMILEDTRMNCGGGTTPWGAWVSHCYYQFLACCD
jgi:hypothetical protein